MDKKNIFKKYIEFIKNDYIKESAYVLVELLPDYFFKIPASSTSKYHPDYASGDGGLVRHTQAAMKIANELLYNNSTYSFTDVEKDLILVAILIHDGFKLGYEESKWTKFDHPLLAAEFVSLNKDKIKLSLVEIDMVKKAISSHMGQWNTSNYDNTALPTPSDGMSKFVHICDFLASRKFIEIIFD